MGMHQESEGGIQPRFARWQRRKQGLLGIGAALTVLLGVLTVVRVVPALDDAISGPPQPMRAIATLTAEQMGAAVGHRYAVFVMQDEGQTCRSTPGDPEYYELTVMMLTYSESHRSLCAMTEAPPVNPRLATTVLHTAEFRNYGHPVKGDIPLVALSFKQIVYPADYLALMNWRTAVKPGAFRHVGPLRSKTDAEPADTRALVDINLPVPVVRARVAEHHHAVNARMDRGLMLLGAAWLAIAGLLLAMFRQVRQEARAYGQAASDPLAFCRCDLAVLARTWAVQRVEAERQRHEQVRAEAHRARQAEALRRDLRQRVTQMLDGRLPEESKSRLRTAIESSADQTALQALYDELLPLMQTECPEDRLDHVLAPARDLCPDEEFNQIRAQAQAILAASGFRAARDWVTGTIQSLRRQNKEQGEDGKGPEANAATGSESA